MVIVLCIHRAPRTSIQAIQKHGFFIGIMMTADRLIHEMNEMDTAPFVEGEGGTGFYDPVENNDYWWYKSNTAVFG